MMYILVIGKCKTPMQAKDDVITICCCRLLGVLLTLARVLIHWVCWFSDDVTLSYPFFHPPRFEILEDGWHAYSVESEFNRILSRSAADWRVSHVNNNFEVAASLVL